MTVIDWIGTWRRGPSRGRRHKTLLRGEELEPRWVPAATTFLWEAEPTSDHKWSTATNWRYWSEDFERWETCSWDYPGRGGDTADSVEFQGVAPGTNEPCTVDMAVTVFSMKVSTGYTSTIQLYNPLKISGTTYGSLLTLHNGATIKGHRPGGETQGQLNLAGLASFEWYGGTLSDVTVDVQRTDATTYAKILAAPAGAETRKMESATLSVSGLLWWTAGGVDVRPTLTGVPKSLVQVNAGGRFDITGTAGQWGTTDPARLDVANAGTVNADLPAAGTATLLATYTTSGTTRVKTGTLKFGGTADQTAGTFELDDNGTAEVAGPGWTLGIRDGTIIGTGTVNGNLVLGHPGGGGGGTIAPGVNTTTPGMPPVVTRTPGTIAITQSFHMFSANSAMQIDVLGATSHDRITVGGYAALAGTLGVWVEPTFTRPLGTKLTFLTTGTGVRQDFASRGVTGPPMWQENGSGRVWAAGKDAASPMTYYIIVGGPPPVGPP